MDLITALKAPGRVSGYVVFVLVVDAMNVIIIVIIIVNVNIIISGAILAQGQGFRQNFFPSLPPW